MKYHRDLQVVYMYGSNYVIFCRPIYYVYVRVGIDTRARKAPRKSSRVYKNYDIELPAATAAAAVLQVTLSISYGRRACWKLDGNKMFVFRLFPFFTQL